MASCYTQQGWALANIRALNVEIPKSSFDQKKKKKKNRAIWRAGFSLIAPPPTFFTPSLFEMTHLVWDGSIVQDLLSSGF